MCMHKAKVAPTIEGWKDIITNENEADGFYFVNSSSLGKQPYDKWIAVHNPNIPVFWSMQKPEYPAGFHIMASKDKVHTYPVKGRGLLATGEQYIRWDSKNEVSIYGECYVMAELYVPSPDSVKAEKARRTRALHNKAKKGGRR